MFKYESKPHNYVWLLNRSGYIRKQVIIVYGLTELPSVFEGRFCCYVCCRTGVLHGEGFSEIP